MNGAQGRYVRVQLSRPGYLSLAEVQVFGAGANLALNKPATQSSTFPGYVTAVASAAVDGNTDGNFFDGSVTATTVYSVSVALGNGDGTFRMGASSWAPSSISASGDFNGDGFPDLAYFELVPSIPAVVNVSVLVGNGDGTFRPSVTYSSTVAVGTTFQPSRGSIVVGDFNGDGRPDIVSGFYFHSGVILGSDSTAALLLTGKGDGTFDPAVRYRGVGTDMVVADLNSDGKPDLIGHFGSFKPEENRDLVSLGNGDGTGQPALGSPLSRDFVAVGDFNGDGNTDIATSDAILLGNGDGSFRPQIPLPSFVTAVASGDFDGDGNPDLVYLANTPGILLGRGDGTFRQGPLLPNPIITVLAVADFNGDGRADILTSNSDGTTTLFLGSTGAFTATAIAGSLQNTVVGLPFPVPLQVMVKDPLGNPVSGVTVTFTAPGIGATAYFSSAAALTNASGIASVIATASNFIGNYTVLATAGNGTDTATAQFLLNNVGPNGPFNLATGKTATQSSTLAGYPGAGAASAIDGRTDGLFQNGSVTATNQELNAWWQVDLGIAANIQSIAIYNRTDCCSERLRDYWVFVSKTPFNPSDTPATLQNRPGIWSNHQTSVPSPSTVLTDAAQGRYVRVQLTGTDYLSLAEVQVLGLPDSSVSTNLALNKVASQSSTLPGYPTAVATSAVDGNTNGGFFGGSVTATNLEPSPWWQVDLGASASVSSVVVWNRTDCCGSRLGDYWVFVSDTPFAATDTPVTLQNRAATFASHQVGAPSPSTVISVNGAQGRYVRVQLSGTDYLSLAEVQVFGTGGAPAPTNVAQGRSASQSSTLLVYPTAGASSAVDGNTNGGFFSGSVTATNLESNPWWQVDLGASKSVTSVVVWNRTDCCSTRLGDYWVFVSDAPFAATDTPAVLQNRAGTAASHQIGAPSPSTAIAVNVRGRYVRVQLSGTDYLSLAEVQVFGQ